MRRPRPDAGVPAGQGDRKLRLFACGCCRRQSHLLVPETLSALAVAERFADGLASPDDRKRARATALSAGVCPDASTAHRRGPAKACVSAALARRAYDAAFEADRLARHIGLLSKSDWDPSAVQMTEWGIPRVVDFSSGRQEQAALHAAALRCALGDAYRPAATDPSWLTPTAVGLARSMYENRDFGGLPVLADALEEAGCDDADVLGHCRGPGPHARGCWVVDLLLGKE